MRNTVWSALLALSLTSPVAGQSDAVAVTRVRILFIGNSYTYVNDLPRSLQSMAAAASSPATVEFGSVLVGGASLGQHWNDGDAVERIRRGDWDYVVLQEQSLLPLENPDALLAYGKRFSREIRAANAKPILYLTWSRKGRPSAQDSLDRAYRQLASEIGATIVPVGPAWREFQRLDPTADLYAQDGSHPSPLGCFVAASVFYRTLFGRPPPAAYGGSLTLTPRTRTAVQRAVEAAFSRFPPVTGGSGDRRGSTAGGYREVEDWRSGFSIPIAVEIAPVTFH